MRSVAGLLLFLLALSMAVSFAGYTIDVWWRSGAHWHEHLGAWPAACLVCLGMLLAGGVFGGMLAGLW